MQATKTKKRPPRQAGMSWLTPALTVRDVAQEMTFCEKAFGFEKGTTVPGKDGALMHGDMKYQGSVVVMMGPEGTPGCECKSPATSKVLCPVNLYVYCSDVDELYRRAKRAGAVIVSEPADMFWGDRITEIEDPNGYRWTFATNMADFDPSKAPR
jgi:uncharacterized glyoxalase superfamily protein PhnB